MSKFIAIESDGVYQVHASGEGAGFPYATLCGLDGDDSRAGQKPAALIIGAKIDCPQCRGIIRAAKTFRPRDFARPLSDKGERS